MILNQEGQISGGNPIKQFDAQKFEKARPFALILGALEILLQWGPLYRSTIIGNTEMTVFYNGIPYNGVSYHGHYKAQRYRKHYSKSPIPVFLIPLSPVTPCFL